MSELIISHSFVRKLASNIRAEYGADVKHTKAIDLVAKSLGWNGDALMHKLKHRDGSNKVSEPKTIVNKFHNPELLQSFFTAVISDERSTANLFEPLIDTDNAWCCLALAFKGQTLRNLNDEKKFERLLVRAFRLDSRTIEYVAKVVGYDFNLNDKADPCCRIVYWSNSNDGVQQGSVFKRPDLMAWAVGIALKKGFIVNTVAGPKIQANPIPKTDAEKLDYLASEDFWDAVKETNTDRWTKHDLDIISSLQDMVIDLIDSSYRRLESSKVSPSLRNKSKLTVENVLELLRLEELVKASNPVNDDKEYAPVVYVDGKDKQLVRTYLRTLTGLENSFISKITYDDVPGKASSRHNAIAYAVKQRLSEVIDLE